MWKTFTDISKQNTFDLCLSAFGCPAKTSQLLNVFEISFGAFKKNSVVGMLGSFRFNNQFINFLLFLMSRQLTKNCVKLSITTVIVVCGHGRVNFKAFTRSKTPLN